MSTREFVVRSAEDLGRIIAEARVARGLTQAELAATADIERTYLARLEAGRTTLQVERTLDLLRRLGVTIHGSLDLDDSHG
jgi:transcriptional regulator with XRE-family HTH domain